MAGMNSNLLKREPILKLKKERGKSGIFLYEEDICMMKQLLIHKSLVSNSIHEIYNSLVPSDSKSWNPNSVSNRLLRLRSAGILTVKKESVMGSLFMYHYRLAKRGLEVLSALHVISKKDAHRLINEVYSLKIPSKHTAGTSILINRTFLNCMKNPLLSNLEHKRGAASPLFVGDDLPKGLKKLIVPDWTFANNNIVVAVEFDTGKQNIGVLESKCVRYIKHARYLTSIGKRLVVVFSSLDESIFDNSPSNRYRRLSSIKEMFPLFTEWNPNSFTTDSKSGINFYATGAKQTAELVENILSEHKPYTNRIRERYALDWYRMAGYLLSNDYELELADLDEFFAVRREKALDCDLVVLLKKNNIIKKAFSFLYGEEGSVITHQRIRANGERIKYVNSVNLLPVPMSLLVCYENSINALDDYFGFELPCDLLLTDSKSWAEAMNSNAEFVAPDILHTVSLFKKEWRRI